MADPIQELLKQRDSDVVGSKLSDREGNRLDERENRGSSS
jgi:hypothetical protein